MDVAKCYLVQECDARMLLLKINAGKQNKKTVNQKLLLIKLICKTKTFYILYTLHYNIILVFFVGF